MQTKQIQLKMLHYKGNKTNISIYFLSDEICSVVFFFLIFTANKSVIFELSYAIYNINGI